MAKESIITNLVIGVFLLAVFTTGLSFLMVDYADSYAITMGDQDIYDDEVYEDISALTNEITNNVMEPGNQDDTSLNQVIAVGWNSLKLITKSPRILFNYMSTVGDTVGLSVAGLDIVSIITVVITTTLIITLVFLIFVGRAPSWAV